jgi:hypothetical protein
MDGPAGAAPDGAGRRTRLIGEVGDAAPSVPRVPSGPPRVLDWSEAGRGLLLVAALATEFGARPGPSGKTVWFTRHLALPPGHATAAPTAANGSGPAAAHGNGAARN